MVKRKIIKLGAATLVASLPSKWIKEFGLKQGDELEVEERGNELVLSASKQDIVNIKEIDISGLDTKSADREVLGAYINGFEEIKIRFNEPVIKNLKRKEDIPVLSFIQEIVGPKMIGMELVEQRQNYCILKDLGTVQDGEFDRILKRVFFMLISICEQTFEAVEKFDKKSALNLKFSRQNIERFLNYAMRILIKRGYIENYNKTPHYFSLLHQLKAITQIFQLIGSELQLRDKKANPQVVLAVEEIASSFKMLYDLFYKYSPQLDVEMVKSRRKFFDLINSLLYNKKLSVFDYVLVSRISFIVAHIFYLAEIRIWLQN